MGAIAHDGEIDLDVLVDRGGIDVDMDLLRMRRESIEATGDAVVEAGANSDDEIAVMHCIVGFIGAVHAQHAEPVLARRRIGAKPHQRRGDGEVRQADELAQQRRGNRPRIDDAATRVEHRLLSGRHHRDGFADLVEITLHLRPIGLVLDVLGTGVGTQGELHILGQIDDDRARPAACGHIESLVQDARQVLDRTHKVIVLRAMAGDADRIAFLESIRADEMGRHLSGEADERNGVHQGVREAGDGIGRAGARGHQQHADLAGRAGIALGRMGRALLVAHQHVLHEVLLEDGVIDRKDRTAGIAENRLDALVLQGLDDHFRTGHLFRHGRLRLVSACCLRARWNFRQ